MSQSERDLAARAAMDDHQLIAAVRTAFMRYHASRYAEDRDSEYRYLLDTQRFLAECGKSYLYEAGQEQWKQERAAVRAAQDAATAELGKRNDCLQ